MDSRSPQRLILFAKRPRLGRVKTRLVPPLSEQDALGLYRALLADSTRACLAVTGGREFELCLDGPWDPQPSDLGGELPPSITVQGAGDLGQRLLRAFRRSREAGAGATVIVGSDSPTLPPDLIESAFAGLEAGSPAVLSEAGDGGYVLIGCREPIGALFRQIPWGGSEVARRTLDRARDAGVDVKRLSPWHDVDDVAGLHRLRDELSDPEVAARAPATASYMAHVDALYRAVL